MNNNKYVNELLFINKSKVNTIDRPVSQRQAANQVAEYINSAVRRLSNNGISAEKEKRIHGVIEDLRDDLDKISTLATGFYCCTIIRKDKDIIIYFPKELNNSQMIAVWNEIYSKQEFYYTIHYLGEKYGKFSGKKFMQIFASKISEFVEEEFMKDKEQKKLIKKIVNNK